MQPNELLLLAGDLEAISTRLNDLASVPVAAVSIPLDADALKAWRQSLGYTQQAAAEVLGCGRRSIQMWEKGSPIPRYIGLACAAVSVGFADGSSSNEG